MWIVIFTLVAILLSLYLFCFRQALIDDAFITFQYARNLRDHKTWGFFPGYTTNTATSPLNVMLTAFAGLFVPDLIEAAIWLAVVEALAMFGLLMLISRKVFDGYYFGGISFIAVMANPLLMSTLGLETLLYIVFILAGIYFFLAQRWYILAVVLALLTLTRPDGILLFVLMLWFVGDEGESSIKFKIKFLALYVICLLPWYLFSWIHLGSFLPDTFFLKFNQNWNGIDYLKGIFLYIYKFPFFMLISFILAPLGFLYILREKRNSHRLAGVVWMFGILYFIGYAILRVPPYHWYYVPVAISFNLVGVFAIAKSLQTDMKRNQKIGLFSGIVFVVCFGILVYFLQSGFSLEEPPVHTNWATQTQYKEIGLWLRENIEPSERIELRGEVGTLTYYSQRRLMDMFSCRYELLSRIDRFEQGGVIAKLFAKINFYWYDPGEPCQPTDYILGFDYYGDDMRAGSIKNWETTTKWAPGGLILLWKAYQP